MPDYSLVPVDYQPDFDDYSLVPVDYDPFAADGPAQQAQFQQAQAQPQRRNRSRNSQQREPVSPASTGRRPATAPADRVAAMVSVGPGGSDAGGGPNPTLDQGGASCSLWRLCQSDTCEVSCQPSKDERSDGASRRGPNRKQWCHLRWGRNGARIRGPQDQRVGI